MTPGDGVDLIHMALEKTLNKFSDESMWPISNIFSSRRVIVIAFCPECIVRCASCVNFFSSVTSGSIGMKLHRKLPLNDLTRFPSNFWDPCRILVSMAMKWKTLQNSSSPKLVVLGQPSVRFLQAMLIGQKTWPPVSRAILHYMAIVKIQKIFFSQTGWQIFKPFCRNVPRVTLYQIPSSQVDWLKTMAARVRGLYS